MIKLAWEHKADFT